MIRQLLALRNWIAISGKASPQTLLPVASQKTAFASPSKVPDVTRHSYPKKMPTDSSPPEHPRSGPLVPPEVAEAELRKHPAIIQELLREHSEKIRASLVAVRTVGTQFATAFRPVERALAEVRAPFARMMGEMGLAVTRIVAEASEVARNAAKVSRGTFAAAERLGTYGWTIPMHAPLTNVVGLLRSITDQASADSAFERYYEEDDSRLVELRQDLLDSPVLTPWKEWLGEALFAFDMGKYRVCVPSLVAIMDGVAHRYWHPMFFRRATRKAFFAGKLSKHEPDGVPYYMWASLRAFVNTVFAKAEVEPAVFNRNWTMHGRGVPAGTRIECIRVLQAIGTFSDHADLEAAGAQPNARA
jgi:hypothetical protein